MIDQELLKIDKNFDQLNWKIFNDFHYCIKRTYDQLIYYSELLSTLIEKFPVKEIVLSQNSHIIFDKNKLISSEISVFETLTKFYKNRKKISFSLMDDRKKIKSINQKIKIKDLLINLHNYLKFNYYLIFKKPKFFSIKCFEIDYFNKLYPKFKYKILNHNYDNYFSADYYKLEGLIKNLIENKEFNLLMEYKNFDFRKIFEQQIKKITYDFSYLLKEYQKNKKYFLKNKPKVFIFGSSNPFYLPNIYYRKIAIDLNIPSAIWVHGGNGGTKSLTGNDILDYRFCKNHISYGKHLSEYMGNIKYGLNRYKKFFWNKDFNFFSIGSPKMDFQFSKSKKINFLNQKKTIVFFTGGITNRNHYYFGNERPDIKNSFWKLNSKITRIFSKYQEKYNFIIKDYAVGQKKLWEKMLHDTNSQKIKYISDKYSVVDIAKYSDLIILPWFSTTFFESLYSDADIFLLEKESIDEFKTKKFMDEVNFFDNESLFLNQIEKYLQNDLFIKKNKTFLRDFFLNLSGYNKRDYYLEDALKRIENSEVFIKNNN